MAVRKIKNSWWVDFMFNYTRYRQRSPENSRAGALAYEMVLRQKVARGEPIRGSQDERPLFEQFAQKWFETYVVPNNKYSVQRSKKYILNNSLVPFLGKMPLGEITSYHIEQFKAKRKQDGLASKTVNNHLSVLKTCLTSGYEWLKLDGAPPQVKWLKCPPPQTDYLSPEECELILSHAEGVVRDLILTALRTGMRQGELKGLQWSSIGWENQNLVVRHSRCDYRKELISPKSNRERHIPLDVDVYEMLHQRKRQTGYVFLDTDGQPFDNKRMKRRLDKVCKKAELRKVGWHTLRHTFATHLAMRGTPMNAIQMLLGHATIATTMRYAHVAPSTLRAAIDMLNPKTLVHANFGQPVVNQWHEAQRAELVLKSASPKNIGLSS